MDKYLKNINHEEVLKLEEQVSYLEGQVVSKTLAQNDHHSLTLFAFAEGEEISSHASDGDAMVICLDGVGEVTIAGQKYELHKGETIVMPAKTPHAVYGKEKFKMFLIVIFPQE